MFYLGGKSRQGKRIAEIIDSTNLGRVVIPFCGALNIEVHLKAPIVESYDACEALITMWKAAQDGWDPPSTLTREEWQALKDAQDPRDPMTAFAGFGNSFGGKWFAGFAAPKEGGPHYPTCARNSIRRKAAKIQRVKLAHQAWLQTRNQLLTQAPCVIYCDPPYAKTTGYGSVGPFDHSGFLDDCEALVAAGHRVLVTEYSNPRGWPVVHTFKRAQRLASNATKATIHDELLLKVPCSR